MPTQVRSLPGQQTIKRRVFPTVPVAEATVESSDRQAKKADETEPEKTGPVKEERTSETHSKASPTKEEDTPKKSSETESSDDDDDLEQELQRLRQARQAKVEASREANQDAQPAQAPAASTSRDPHVLFRFSRQKTARPEEKPTTGTAAFGDRINDPTQNAQHKNFLKKYFK